MASAASRHHRSAFRIAFRTTLLCTALSACLEAAIARAYEPTKPVDSTTNPPKAAGEPVKIDTGSVQGVAASESGDVVVFRGIPYAAPPVGDLRWRPPQPAKSWEGVRECAKFGTAAPQEPRRQDERRLPVPQRLDSRPPLGRKAAGHGLGSRRWLHVRGRFAAAL